MEVYRSHYQEIVFDEERNMLKQVYFPESRGFNKEIFKKDHLAINDAVKKNLGKNGGMRLLVDMRDLDFTIDPELQGWHNTNVLPVVHEVGVTQMAIVVSPNIFTEISVQQTIEDNKNSPITFDYFTTEEAALDWLFN